MKPTHLLLYALSVSALAERARRNCPQEQCLNATNACGETFINCWDECSISEIQPVRFTAPPCNMTTPTTITTYTSYITAAPTETQALATTICVRGTLTACIDYPWSCGNRTGMYGGCYDVCDPPQTYASPPCTLHPISKTAWHETQPTLARALNRRPKASRLPCANEKSWMCAPAGW